MTAPQGLLLVGKLVSAAQSGDEPIRLEVEFDGPTGKPQRRKCSAWPADFETGERKQLGELYESGEIGRLMATGEVVALQVAVRTGNYNGRQTYDLQVFRLHRFEGAATNGAVPLPARPAAAVPSV